MECIDHVQCGVLRFWAGDWHRIYEKNKLPLLALRNLSSWDLLVAGAFLIQEAGGLVTDDRLELLAVEARDWQDYR
jgi:hypothetical protein